jgi:fluoride exporter
VSGAQGLWVFVAGGVGSVARWLVSLGCLAAFGPLFPVGTLTVNLVGCFLIAALFETAVSTDKISAALRVTLASGFIGGFTTYSAFSNELFTYFRDGALGLAAAYLIATVLGCLGACLLGQLGARWWIGL